jgi:hypothetical protein
LVDTALGGEKRETENLERAKREEIFDFWITAVILTIFSRKQGSKITFVS